MHRQSAACETAYCGSLDQEGDEDWWAIDLPNDTSYCLHVRVFGDDTPNQYAYGGGLDPNLTIYADDCSTVLYFNEDYNGQFPDAEHWDSQYDCACGDCFAPGSRVYIKIAGYANTSTGPYLLIINCDTCDVADYPPEGSLNLHNIDGYLPLDGDPIGTQWRELWPNYPQMWNITSWVDNGDAILSVSDSLDFNGEPTKYHVEWVGPTLKLYDTHTTDTAYWEYNGFDNFLVDPIVSPEGTCWREIRPNDSRLWRIQSWSDNGNGYLDSGDVLNDYTNSFNVLDYATDIILTGGEEPWPDHKMHYPQLPDEAGWDVKASPTAPPGSVPQFIADDWRCSQTGWVKDIHFWGSWKNGVEGPVLGYNLRIYSDIPADPPSIPYSRPGDLLWDKVPPGIVATPINPQTMEGWYDPYTGEILPDNHQQYFQYDILLDSTDWFFQDSGRVYWLAICAIPLLPDIEWGWKSSLDHWNDNAVMELNLSGEWIELQEPPAGGPLDMAFVITGEAGEFSCDCLPGDANNSGNYNILDVTYLINYLYKGGPPPVPYALCSGDPNASCSINILDVTYEINYLYKGGAAPATCQYWVSRCGLPLRK